MLKVTCQTLALCVLLQSFASAKLIMPVTFGDGMVLQRDTAVTIFGEASEGCGDLEDIHPTVKKPIGDRLAIAVSAEVYGHNHQPYGPVFESVEFRDAQAELRFRYAEGGVKLSADPDGSFEIAGADQAFVRADVELKGAALLLCNVSVKHPAYVRYAYSPYPNMVLFNQAGLPASPFTTEKSD